MPVVLVHGVPETSDIWTPLRRELGRDDVHALRLPGFGYPRPSGFAATKEAYVAWLVETLESLQGEGPIDLVGHDWGGGFVARVVSTRPDLVRSWASDAVALANPDFEWHDMAKLWQTPEIGEATVAQMLAMPDEERAHMFDAFGVPEGSPGFGGIDLTMTTCILALYRSAVNVGEEWGPDFRAIPKPGLALIPTDDPFLSVEHMKRAAELAGARIAELRGCGHWWMLQDPAAGARTLAAFWKSVAP
jgi:pimeloyl-ACP methyl ester carboxylesterase